LAIITGGFPEARSMKVLIVLFLLVAGIWIWKTFMGGDPQEEASPVEAPIEQPQVEPLPEGPPTELTDREGRTVPISEITRYEHYIRFVRGSDGRVFDITMDQLSPESRRQVETMEITVDPRSEDIDHAAIHRRILEDQIKGFDERIDQMRFQMTEASSAQQRSLRRQINELEERRAEARSALQRMGPRSGQSSPN